MVVSDEVYGAEWLSRHDCMILLCKSVVRYVVCAENAAL